MVAWPSRALLHDRNEKREVLQPERTNACVCRVRAERVRPALLEDKVMVVTTYRVAHDEPWSYADRALLLAPMVRINKLPFRLLAAEHGAAIAYSEELVDHAVRNTTRSVNPATRAVEFRSRQDFKHQGQANKLIFSTLPNERVSFQLGTASGPAALDAARVVVDDVRAIDVNMGCPVHFSTQGGMGSALLSRPETVHDILRTLVSNLAPKPVTCKIRLLDEPHKTLELARLIWDCGVSALAVHVRRIADRPRHWAQWDQFVALRQHAPAHIPLVLNGDVFYPEDIPRAFELTNADSLMLARGAMWNPALFRRDPAALVPHHELVARFIELAEEHSNAFPNSKYVCLQMVEGHGKSQAFQLFSRARDYADLRAAVAAMADDALFAGPPRHVPPQEPPPGVEGAPSHPMNAWRPAPHYKQLPQRQKQRKKPRVGSGAPPCV